MTDISCSFGNDGANSSDGSIDLTVSGGSGTYSYSWSNGSQEEDLYELLPGTYNVEVSDEFGCSIDLEFQILAPENVSISHTQINNSCFESNDKYDIVIALSNLRCLSLMALSLRPNRKFKLIYWGIGVSASTKNGSKFDQN